MQEGDEEERVHDAFREGVGGGDQVVETEFDSGENLGQGREATQNKDLALEEHLESDDDEIY